MTSHMLRAIWICLGALIFLCDCRKSTDIPPAPAPRRPKEVKIDRGTDEIPTDCEPTDEDTLPPSMDFKQRSIAESRNLADEGFKMLTRAEETSVPRPEREELVTRAVDRFIVALQADPYNVHATYNLAAAYARIGRPQCAVNLLDRLVNLRELPNFKAEVEEKFDRMLGRGKFRRRMDRDFHEMRDMKIFRDLVKEICPSLPADKPLDECR